MDHVAILKKAWGITFRYRSLWILGFLWALVGGSGSNGGGRFPNFANNFQENGMNNEMSTEFSHLTGVISHYLGWILLSACLLFLLAIIMAVLRYVLQAGVYRVLYRLEVDHVAPSVKAGFREGWHRRTWRLFFQNFLIGVLATIGVLVLLVLAASPLLLLLTHNDSAHTVGIVVTVGLMIPAILVIVVLAIVISVLSQFWWRAAIIDDMGTLGAVSYAWNTVKTNFRDVAIMWLLMLGVGVLFGLLVIVFVMILVTITAAVAGLPGYLLYQATQSVFVALLWGLPVAIIAFLLPILFVSGLYLIFRTAVWNDVYLSITRKGVRSGGSMTVSSP